MKKELDVDEFEFDLDGKVYVVSFVEEIASLRAGKFFSKDYGLMCVSDGTGREYWAYQERVSYGSSELFVDVPREQPPGADIVRVRMEHFRISARKLIELEKQRMDKKKKGGKKGRGY